LKKLLAGIFLTVFICGPSWADEQRSAVQMAAAAKLAGSFGSLRGAIKPDDEHIYLTTKILQQWHPVAADPVTASEISPPPASNTPPSKPKLPPIVWEFSPDQGRKADPVMTGSTSPKKPPATTAFPPELTVARVNSSPYTIDGLFGAPDTSGR
jgi:hypothetical protein